MENLNLASTKELILEVLKRFDHCIIVGLQERKKDNHRFEIEFNGDVTKCLGLCILGQDGIMKRIARTRSETTEENMGD